MKIGIPQNIFSAMLIYALDEEVKNSIEVLPAAQVSSKLETGEIDLGIIPSFDLITHKEFAVSSKVAISFDGELSNTQIYFKEGDNQFTDIYMKGDVSSNEVILSKIIFKERFSSNIVANLDTEEFVKGSKNYILIGNMNLEEDLLESGMSFSDQVAEFLDYPYVNFVVASTRPEFLEWFNSKIENIDKTIEDKIDEILSQLKLTEKVKSYLKDNLNTIYYEFTDNEKEGLNQLLRLPYYHGIIDDIVDVDYV